MDDVAKLPPLYEVVSQQESVDLAPNGSYLNGVRIAFRTRSGANGSVFVPHIDYTVERVRTLLAERAQAMETVHNLTGEG